MFKLKSVLDFFIFSNIYVAIPVSALSHSTFLILGSTTNVSTLFFTYFSTLFLYNFHRIYGVFTSSNEVRFIPQRIIWSVKHKNLVCLLSLFSAIVAGYFLLEIYRSIYWILLPCFIISLAYTLPIVPLKNGMKKLREIPLIKPIVIAFIATIVTVIFPFLTSNYSSMITSDYDIWFLYIERFLFLLAITIPFDIRDVKFDAADNTKTLPLIVGVNIMKRLSFLSLIFFAIIVGIHSVISPNYQSNMVLAYLFSFVFTGVILFFVNQDRSEYFFSLLVEGTMIVQWVGLSLSS